MRNRFDVSVVIPLYNHERYIESAISSILGAKLNIQIIIINDGSSDRSLDIAQASILNLPKNIKCVLVDQKNNGLIRTLNRGLELAEAPIVGQLASDDMYTAGQIEASVKAFEADKEVGLVFSLPYIIDENNTVGARLIKRRGWLLHILKCKDKSYTELLKKNYLPGSTIFYRRSCLIDCGGMDDLLVNRGEISLHWKISINWKLKLMDGHHGYYRIHSASTWLSMARDLNKLRDDYLLLLGNFIESNKVDGKVARSAISYIKYEYLKMALFKEKRLYLLFRIFGNPFCIMHDIKKQIFNILR